MKYFYCYLILINLLAFIFCAADKHAARKHRWRISEKTLFIVTLPGGAAGFYLSMLLFRHKTRHLSFAVGMPALALLQAGAIWYFFMRI